MKNKSVLNDLLFMIAILTLSILFACQKSQMAEYKKYESESDVPRITAEEAKKDVDAGTAIIVDSRPEVAYKTEHIAGSINIPFGSAPEEYSDVPKDKKIIVYCS